MAARLDAAPPGLGLVSIPLSKETLMKSYFIAISVHTLTASY
jgi:hypothetical protein